MSQTNQYWSEVHDVKGTIETEDVVMISLKTRIGSIAGVPVEMPRELAAKAIVDSTHRLATPEEAAAFVERSKAIREKGIQERAALNLQAAVIERNLLTLSQGQPEPALKKK